MLDEVQQRPEPEIAPQPTPEDPFDAVRLASLRADLGYRRTFAQQFRIGMFIQLAIADLVFFIYAWVGEDWKVPTAAINVWLSATVVQVIGIVLVITQNLFPRRDSGPSQPHP